MQALSVKRQYFFQIHKLKPNLYLIPGDVSITGSKVEDYLLRFFPFLNATNAAANRELHRF
ncbi:MAG: hypothetical protein R3F51_13330 [Cyanobacteriota/Melainabacteria group bacterium]